MLFSSHDFDCQVCFGNTNGSTKQTKQQKAAVIVGKYKMQKENAGAHRLIEKHGFVESQIVRLADALLIEKEKENLVMLARSCHLLGLCQYMQLGGRVSVLKRRRRDTRGGGTKKGKPRQKKKEENASTTTTTTTTTSIAKIESLTRVMTTGGLVYICPILFEIGNKHNLLHVDYSNLSGGGGGGCDAQHGRDNEENNNKEKKEEEEEADKDANYIAPCMKLAMLEDGRDQANHIADYVREILVEKTVAAETVTGIILEFIDFPSPRKLFFAHHFCRKILFGETLAITQQFLNGLELVD